ncbi:MAG: DUF1028 domain-containing protein [Actinobacteria bacterium]|nr:DUF1028 domain-containing protein [Actinomycetota bacterium]
MTYSIVARDPQTGQLGVAVQSHAFSVGPIVPWARAGVGVVATQSIVNPGYGPKGLELMAGGLSATEALAQLVAADEEAAVRQVAMVDAHGIVAAHTGERCIAAAGHVCGGGFSCQANMMFNDTVWDAMAAAYREADGDLAARLMAALHAAESEGGDIRGRESSALLVVAAVDSGEPWMYADVLVDLRVEDHPEPLTELERLLRLQRAFSHTDEADKHQQAGDMAGFWEKFSAAEYWAPDSVELQFWKGVTLAEQGRESEARAILIDVYRRDPNWAELLRRLAAVDLALVDAQLIVRLTAPPA